MSDAVAGVIISLFTVLLYIGLGTYVLTKNPHDRTNRVFVLLMIVFIMWSVGTYNIGLVVENTPLKEMLFYAKLQLIGVILAFTFFFFFGISLTKKGKIFKNPLLYLFAIPSLYLLNLVWTSEVSGLELNVIPTMVGRKQDFFLYSAIFGIVGVYLLLRHYMTSRYRQQEQAEVILTGAILAVLVAVISNILLPMFSGVYFLPLSTLAPALMGVFFAYAIYQHGLFIKPMPEVSVTSFCGVECTICPEYLEKNCLGCRYDMKYRSCDVYMCLINKKYRDCGECSEPVTCLKRKDSSESCFGSKLDINEKGKSGLTKGCTYFVKDEGYNFLLEAVKCGALGFVVSTMHPQQVKEKYGLSTTPIAWISDEAFDMGVKPNDLKRLSLLIINFMKKIDNTVVFLDGMDMLISINGYDKVQPVVHILSSAAQTTNSTLIISTDMEDEALCKLKPLYFVKRNKH